jgi:S1-C subfamily serine protease
MRTRIALTFAALLSLVLLIVVRPLDEPVVRMPTSIEQARKTTFVLLAEDGQASCSPIMNSGGVVAWLTCRHVVEAQPQSLKLADGTVVAITGTAVHPTRDVGVIWTAWVPVVPIPLGVDAAPGTEAVHAGFPAALGLWLSQGLVGSPDADGDVWSSVPAFYGCSGGPVIADGRIVGVVMGIYSGSNGMFSIPVGTMSCVVPADSFRDWLRDSLSRGPSAK